MRSFPRAARRRLAVASVAALTLAALTTPASLAAPDSDQLRQQRHSVRQEIRAVGQRLVHASRQAQQAEQRAQAAWAQLRQARLAVGRINQQLAAAVQRDQQARTALAAAQQRLTQAEQRLTAGVQAVAAQREVVGDTVTEVYQQGDPRLRGLVSLLEQSTPEDMMRAAEIERTVVHRQGSDYRRLAAAEQALRQQRNEVRTSRNQVAAQRRAAAARVSEVQQLREQAVGVRQTYLEKVAGARTARDQARAARQADQRHLQVLHAQEQRIKQQILAALAREDRAYTGPTDGLFLPPADGPVTSPYGMRVHPIRGYRGMHDGTDFGAPCGSPLRAVATGTVIARYWSSVYGHRLYLSVGTINGKNVTAVYNHAQGYRYAVGQAVPRGAVLGRVGSTGWSTGCHLHFTVLENGDHVDPARYL